MNDRVIEVDVSPQTIANDRFSSCPLCNTEFNTCRASLSGQVDCCCWDEDRDIHYLNPLCPLLRGAVT